MNTNPDAVTVLCYGDSNTYGQTPDRSGRFPANERWTGRLQSTLGDKYYVIEEGLGSRTTDLEFSEKPGRNGKTYFMPCLASHGSLDVVIIMLGTNDLKIEYSRSASEIANSLRGLVADVRQDADWSNRKCPDVILVSPIVINDQAPRFSESYTSYYDNRSAKESMLLAAAVKAVADSEGCIFLNAADVATPGEDGIHLSPDSNQPLCEMIAHTISGS